MRPDSKVPEQVRGNIGFFGVWGGGLGSLNNYICHRTTKLQLLRVGSIGMVSMVHRRKNPIQIVKAPIWRSKASQLN